MQACIDVYGDRTDRAEALVAREPGPAPDLPAVDRRRWRPTSRRSATSTRCGSGTRGAPALGPAVPRPHDRAVRGVYGRCFAGRRRVRPARPRRGRGAPARRGRPGQGVGRPPLARRAAGRGAARRAALRTRRARRGRAAAGGEPRAGRRERRRRLHDRELRRARPDQGPPRCRREAAELLAEGAKVAERLDLTRLSRRRRRRTDPAAPRRPARARGAPGRAGPARRRGLPRRDRRGDRPDPHRLAGRGAVRRGRPRRGRGVARGADRRPRTARPGPGRGRRRRSRSSPSRNGRRGGSPRSARSPRRWRSCVPAGLRQTVVDGGPEVTAVAHRLAGAVARRGRPPVPGLAELLARGRRPATDAAGLNGRELAILRMLDVGRSNQQIARELDGHRQHGEVVPEEHLRQARRDEPGRGRVDGPARRCSCQLRDREARVAVDRHLVALLPVGAHAADVGQHPPRLARHVRAQVPAGRLARSGWRRRSPRGGRPRRPRPPSSARSSDLPCSRTCSIASADPLGLLLQAGGHVAQRGRGRERHRGGEQVRVAVHAAGPSSCGCRGPSPR